MQTPLTERELKNFIAEIQESKEVPSRARLATFFQRVKRAIYYGIIGGVSMTMLVGMMSGVALVIETAVWNARMLHNVAVNAGSRGRWVWMLEWRNGQLIAYLQLKAAKIASMVLGLTLQHVGILGDSLNAAIALPSLVLFLAFRPFAGPVASARMATAMADPSSILLTSAASILGVMRYYPSYLKILRTLAHQMIQLGLAHKGKRLLSQVHIAASTAGAA
jgi:hypothetical protein